MGYSRSDPDTAARVLDLLPVHVRARDEQTGGLLRALVEAVAGELAVLEADIDELYASWFVETCPEWVVPYLADLVGVVDLPPDVAADAGVSRRAFVANTVRLPPPQGHRGRGRAGRPGRFGLAGPGRRVLPAAGGHHAHPARAARPAGHRFAAHAAGDGRAAGTGAPRERAGRVGPGRAHRRGPQDRLPVHLRRAGGPVRHRQPRGVRLPGPGAWRPGGRRPGRWPAAAGRCTRSGSRPRSTRRRRGRRRSNTWPSRTTWRSRFVRAGCSPCSPRPAWPSRWPTAPATWPRWPRSGTRCRSESRWRGRTSVRTVCGCAGWRTWVHH